MRTRRHRPPLKVAAAFLLTAILACEAERPPSRAAQPSDELGPEKVVGPEVCPLGGGAGNPESLLQGWMFAIERRDLAGLKALVHPACLAKVDETNRFYFDKLFEKWLSMQIPDKHSVESVEPVSGAAVPLEGDGYEYPVHPTHLVVTRWEFLEDLVSATLPKAAVCEGGRWFLVLPVPKPRAVARLREARALRMERRRRGRDMLSRLEEAPLNQLKGLIVRHGDDDALELMMGKTDGDRAVAREAVALVRAKMAEEWELIDEPLLTDIPRTNLDVQISVAAEEIAPKSLPYAGKSKHDLGRTVQREVLVLPIVLRNTSRQTLTTTISHEWYGGVWPPTNLWAHCTWRRPGRWKSFHRVFLQSERWIDEGTIVVPPGESEKLEIRMDWPGTGSCRAEPLMDPSRSATYHVRFLLIFEAAGRRQYAMSPLSTVKVKVE